jgi:hypothetical protein
LRFPFDIIFQGDDTFADARKIFENVQDTQEREKFFSLHNEIWKTFLKKIKREPIGKKTCQIEDKEK